MTELSDLPIDLKCPSPLETVPADEGAAIATITKLIEERVLTAAGTDIARRDAHPKAHGCVKAEFRVLEDLPAPLRQGLFATPAVYQAWVRFSNGSGSSQRDAIGDGRGMAIKVLNVADSATATQDFVLINHPVFFVRNAADYVVLQSSPLRFFLPSWNPLTFRLHEASIGLRIALHKVRNVLNIRYWSMTPYSFGETACKFSVRPAGPASSFVSTARTDYLRDNLVAQLAVGVSSFDFMVQLRTIPATMPIEDPTIEWREADAPFVPVAVLTIARQAFDTPAQHDLCENLSFTPWHCVPAHRPLGGLNRVRGIVYDRISRLRHKINDRPRAEPRDLLV